MTKEKPEITKKIKIGELIKEYPKAADILLKEGLMCVMCGMAQQETLEQGAKAHGIDIEKLIKKLKDSVK